MASKLLFASLIFTELDKLKLTRDGRLVTVTDQVVAVCGTSVQVCSALVPLVDTIEPLSLVPTIVQAPSQICS